MLEHFAGRNSERDGGVKGLMLGGQKGWEAHRLGGKKLGSWRLEAGRHVGWELGGWEAGRLGRGMMNDVRAAPQWAPGRRND